MVPLDLLQHEVNCKLNDKLRIGIVGAAGIGAGKLLEILARHPNATLHSCVSESSPGVPVWKSHPQLRGIVNQSFDTFDAGKLRDCDVVFSCKKGGQSFAYIWSLLDSGTRVIDFSGDYRLKSAADFEKWYGIPHEHPNLLSEAIYGLPEWYREEIRKARLVSNPGCYTTTAILAVAPILAAGIGEDKPVVINAISGVSGAGRAAKPENLFISVDENVRAYRVGNHQHTPEIEQEIGVIAKYWMLGRKATRSDNASPAPVLFVPHVGPYRNGIMADCYLSTDGTNPRLSDEYLYDLLTTAYAGEPFVRVYEPGSLPQVDFVTDTNFCDIGARYDARTGTVVLISCTDNLVKGAAGQAVQNMNIMFGLGETTGLI